MLKTTAKVVVAAAFALSLCACGSSGGNQTAPNTQPAEETADDSSKEAELEAALQESVTDESEEEEYDPNVESIDLTLDGGNIRFNRVEEANPELTDSDHALIFVFDFTNEQSTPAQAQSVFRFQFFQNGTELTNNLSYNSKGGEQYELVGAFFNEAMKGGTVTFGKIVEPKDDSPITIMVSPNGAALEDNYQMMEVPIDGSDSTSDKAPEVSADDVDAALQGSWQMGTDGTWTFDQGAITFEGNGASLSGTYEVDVDKSAIKGHLEASDGTVNITLPFEYDGKTLKVFRNKDKADELAKQ